MRLQSNERGAVLTSGFLIEDIKPQDGAPPTPRASVKVTFLWAADLAGWLPSFVLEPLLEGDVIAAQLRNRSFLSLVLSLFYPCYVSGSMEVSLCCVCVCL